METQQRECSLQCSPGARGSAPRCSEKGTQQAAGASLGLEGPEGTGGDVCHVCAMCRASWGPTVPGTSSGSEGLRLREGSLVGVWQPR